MSPLLIMNISNDISLSTSSKVELNMTHLLNERLKQKGCVFPRSAFAERDALSKRLGKLLALAAPSNRVADAVDKTTFDMTIRNLQSVIEKRRKKAVPQQSRRQHLIQAVGTKRAQQIIALIREIRVLRLRRKDLLGGQALESRQTMMCGPGGCSAHVYTLKTNSSSGRLAKEVRDIFFNTAIVDALEKPPLSSFEKAPWDLLYEQGQRHVRAYRSWLQEQKGSVREDK